MWVAARLLAAIDGDEEEQAGATPGALMDRAKAAIDAYDDELARSLLERAVEVSGGAPGPAAALLALLVDTLGDDTGALARGASLSGEALADGAVRGALAIAAARTGDDGRAIGAHAPSAASAFAALARAALGRGDVERAAAHLEQAKQVDRRHPSSDDLTGALAQARARARGPAEAELAALVAAGREGEARRWLDAPGITS